MPVTILAHAFAFVDAIEVQVGMWNMQVGKTKVKFMKLDNF